MNYYRQWGYDENQPVTTPEFRPTGNINTDLKRMEKDFEKEYNINPSQWNNPYIGKGEWYPWKHGHRVPRGPSFTPTFPGKQ